MIKAAAKVLVLFGILWPLSAWASEPVISVDPAELSAIFNEAEVNGTFVLYDPLEQRITVYNAERANRRFVPASTFKIINTLIGLETGAVSDVDEIFPWDGQPKYLPAWEKDMGLREAIKVSNLEVYQELARRIGYKNMQTTISNWAYGNHDIGTESDLDNFWLAGPIKISAIEQAVFLARLGLDKLPVTPQNTRIVKEITLYAETPARTLHAKTGFTGSFSNPPLGWWVGLVVERDTGRVWSFALNLDMPNYPAGPDRITLGLACLQALRIWP